MSSLLVFNRVFRLEIQSVMLILSTSFLNCCPSKSKTTVYYRQWGGRVWGRGRGEEASDR
jgi:hypothetical protein